VIAPLIINWPAYVSAAQRYSSSSSSFSGLHCYRPTPSRRQLNCL